MATAAIDAAYISKSYDVPQTTVATLLDAPTTELVRELLVALSTKAQEHEELKNELFRSDTELQTAVRNGDSKARALKESVDKGLRDLEEVRKRLNEEENTRAGLESELQNVKSSTSTSSSEAEVLRTRINTLEASNRETLALLEAKSTSYDRLAEELSAQQQKINALRREVSELEEKNQAAQNASTSTKFRQQALEQEVDLLKRNNESYESEIKAKNDAHSKFRKEKSAKISELQRKYDDANETIESLRRTESTLRNRLDEVNQKADDAFVKIQQLQEAAVRSEESFRVELDSQKRLAELQKESANTARARLKEVQENLEKIKEDAAEEIGTLQAEVETERREKDIALGRLSELESDVERLEADLATRPVTLSVAGTPRRVNGLAGVSTPGRSGSPGAFSPNASRVRGPTMTQLYSEHAQLKSDLDAERHRNAKLSSTIDEMIQELEAKQPEIEELRTGHSKLEAEVLEISELLEESNKSRDAAKKEARKWSGEVNGLQREGDILRQQLSDLSKQVQGLLLEIMVRNEGLESITAAERAFFEKAQAGDLDIEEELGESDTARVISQRFVAFTNVTGLQQQNEKLLRIVRDLGERMEGEEARAKQNQQEKDQKELEELRRKASRYEDELKTLNTVSESYQRERDMFRRMLTHRGQIPPGSDIASIFGRSVDGRASATPQPPGFSQSVGDPGHSKDLSDYAKLLKDLQSHFDAYRKEAATDHSMLKEQSDRLAKEKSNVQIEINRVNSQLTLAHERYELLQTNYNQLRSENAELQKRSQSLAEISAQQDLKTARAAEELFDARTESDGLRREAANLKAEKELWKNIEGRLTDDNRALVDERARLNKMITDLQNLQNERELTDAENRRRLQTRIESLETELHGVKRKLDDEVDDNKRAALRREYETEQNRTRIDDLVRSLGNTREELVAAKTQRDQLQARVDEMKIELHNAEERAQALQPRPTPRREDTNAADTDQSNELSREQELALEIADLKRDLEHAQRELADARKDCETYSKISQDAEEALSNANDIHDQFRDDMDQTVAEKDAKIQDLEQRVEEISSELATTNSELSQLRTGHEENMSKFNDQKAVLDGEIARLKDECERYQETAKFCKEDLKAQAEIAQQAQQSYENELIRHAEASQNLREERAEHAKVKTEVSESKAEAEAARQALASSEDSWAETRSRYEQEVEDLKQRREDVNNQNRILHQQLETVSSQIAALKQKRASLGGEAGETDGTPAADTSNLQEVIRYLRREKEIVDVQYELSIQEAKRLRQQLDHSRSELEQVREKLNQERQSQIDKEQSAVAHTKLMETINELNLFRESSTTLRSEARQAQAQLSDKVKEVENLMATIEPLQTRVREAENDLETKDGELRLLQEDRDRWQQRTQNILQKYDRVDPEELAQLKAQIDNLQAERDEAFASKEPLQEQVDRFPIQIEEAVKEGKAELRTRLQEQFKARSRELSAQMRDKDAAREAAIQEKDQLAQQLTELQAELDNTKAELDNTKTELANVRSELEGANKARDEALASAKPTDTAMQDSTEEGQVDESDPRGLGEEDAESLRARTTSAEAKSDQETARASLLQQQVEALQGKVVELEAQLNNTQQQLIASQDELSQHKEATSTGPDTQIVDSESLETLEKLKGDLATAQQEVESLRATAATTTAPIDAATSDGLATQPVATDSEDVVSRIAAIEAAADERAKAAEELFKERTEKMKATLTKKLTDGKEKVRQELREEHDKALEQLKTEHEAEIQRIKTEHEQELQRIKSEHAEELQRIKSENTTPPGQHVSVATAPASGGNSDPSNGVKSELSDAEAKELVSSNPTIKAIVARNIRNKLNQQLEDQTAKDKELFEKQLAEKLEEAKVKAEVAKNNAVSLSEKRQSVKLSMAQSKEKTAQLKLEVVEKAAEETPQRPVVEVWAIAKVTKPTPVAVPAAAAPAAAIASANPSPSPSTQEPANQAKPAVQPPAAQQPTTFDRSVSLPQSTQLQHQAQTQFPNTAPVNQFQSQQGQPPASPFAQAGQQGARSFSQSQQGPPSNGFTNAAGIQRPGSAMGRLPDQPLGAGAMNNNFRPNSPFGGPANRTNPPFGQAAGSFGIPTQQSGFGAPQQQPPTQMMGAGQNQSQPHFRPSINAGTGPAALQSLVRGGGTSLPVPRGGGIPRPSGRGGNQQQAGQQQSQLPRGGGHGRGRGRGGRGGNQQMDPAASQFTPSSQGQQQQQGGGRGGKRPHPDGDESGAGKRSRVSE